jgi:hypothetical protein
MKRAIGKVFVVLLTVCFLALFGACAEQLKESGSSSGESGFEAPSIGDWEGSDNELPLVPIE